MGTAHLSDQLISPKATKQVLRDYFGEYKKHPWRTAVAFFLPAIGSIFVFFAPPLVVAKLINLFAERGVSLEEALPYVAVMAGLWLIGELGWRVGSIYQIKMIAEGGSNLNKMAIRRLLERDYEFFTNQFVGSLTRKAHSFSRSFEIFSDTLSHNILSNIFPMVFAVVVLWRFSPWIPVVLLTLSALILMVLFPIIRKRSRLVAERHDAASRVTGRISDALSNALAIKSFAKEAREFETYGELVDDWTMKFKRAADYHNYRIDFTISPMYVATNAIGLATAILFSGRFGLAPGTVFIVFSYYAQVTRVFWEFNHIYRAIESSLGEAAEFTNLFLERPKVEDAPGAGELAVSRGEIAFEDVNFSYPEKSGKRALFLENFSLTIKSGEKVGLVGPSGGGKTTITKLILRFLDVEGGAVKIDGHDISKVTQKSLREAIAYVPQEPLLFHRSLAENIAYAHEDATEEEILRAAKLSHAHEFIRELPHGYETLVGERGIKLSGGQRQRVAIARAILKRAPILVLDEATSSLDSESEKYIQDGLHELMKEKTALVIAHRLSTLKNLDRIVVLDHGKIVEDGTHAELIERKGLYAKLWSHQSGEFLAPIDEDEEESQEELVEEFDED